MSVRAGKWILTIAIVIGATGWIAWRAHSSLDFKIGPTALSVEVMSMADAVCVFEREVPLAGLVRWPTGCTQQTGDPAMAGILETGMGHHDVIWRIDGKEVPAEILAQGCGDGWSNTVAIPYAPSEGSRQAEVQIGGQWTKVVLPYRPEQRPPNLPELTTLTGSDRITAVPIKQATSLCPRRYRLTTGSHIPQIMLGQMSMSEGVPTRTWDAPIIPNRGDLYVPRGTRVRYKGDLFDAEITEFDLVLHCSAGTLTLKDADGHLIYNSKTHAVSHGFDLLQVMRDETRPVWFSPSKRIRGGLGTSEGTLRVKALGYRLRNPRPFSFDFDYPIN